MHDSFSAVTVDDDACMYPGLPVSVHQVELQSCLAKVMLARVRETWYGSDVPDFILKLGS